MGAGGDVTSAATIAADARFTAEMNCREPIVVAGLDIAAAFFRALDPRCGSSSWSQDGDARRRGAVLMRLDGNARAMLTAERSALNTLQHLSGIATLTRHYVDAIAGTGAILLDTRKTIPGLRAARQICGADGRRGEPPHAARRRRADQGQSCRGVRRGRARRCARPRRRIPGCRSRSRSTAIDQIEPALAAGADRLLLDNMPPPMLREAVALVAGRVPLEASGGVNLDTIRGIAETGVDYISVGRITQSAPGGRHRARLFGPVIGVMALRCRVRG